MALAQYIADDLGLELEVVTVDFDGVLSELSTKSVDLGMAGLSPDPSVQILWISLICITWADSLWLLPRQMLRSSTALKL